MNEVIGDLLPSAIGVALSPIPIIAVILMLATPRARVAGPAFAAGWLVGLVLVSTIVLVVAQGADDPDSVAGNSTSILKLVLGLLFLALAVRQWQSRPKRGEAPAMPAWMASIDSFSAGKCFALGALLSGVNPKNLALTVASAATIAEAGLSRGGSVAAVGVFVVVGSLSVAGPVACSIVASDWAAGPLASLKELMSDNVAVIMMVIFLILGAKLLGAGWAGLST